MKGDKETERTILITRSRGWYKAVDNTRTLLVVVAVGVGLLLLSKLLGSILPSLFGYAGESIALSFDLVLRILILLVVMLIIWLAIEGFKQSRSGSDPSYRVSTARIELSRTLMRQLDKDGVKFEVPENFERYLRLRDIGPIGFKQDRLGRLFNYGDLEFKSDLASDQVLVFQGIPDPLQFKQKTEQIIREFANSPAAAALGPDVNFVDQAGSKEKKNSSTGLGCVAIIVMIVALLSFLIYHSPNFQTEAIRPGETRELNGVLSLAVSDARKAEFQWTDEDTRTAIFEVKVPPDKLDEFHRSLDVSAELISGRVEEAGPTLLTLRYVTKVRVSEHATDSRMQIFLQCVHPKLKPPWILNDPVQRLTIIIKGG